MKELIRKKADGYSLPFAILVFVIVIILSGSLTMAAYQNYKMTNRFFIMEKMDSNVMSALNIVIAHPNDFEYSKSQMISLYDEKMDSVLLDKEKWGVFDIIRAKASFAGISKCHSTMIGSYRYDSTSLALFIPDAGESIALVGNVNINGTCKLPESRFSQPSVEGKNFTGNTKSVNAMVSGGNLPKMSPQLASLSVDDAISSISEGRLLLYEDWTDDTLSIPFASDSTTILYSHNPIELTNKCVLGRVKIISEKSITIPPSATISEVLCFAPYIHVTEGFSGRCQLLASDSIIVEEGCQLKYPSVTGVNNKGEEPSKLVLKKDCKVKGVVFLNSQQSTCDQDVLHIDSGVLVEGQVFSNRYTEIKGEINGSLYTNKLILKTPSAIYENTIMDATIDLKKLSRNYVGVDMLDEGTMGGVVKWLY